MDLKLHAANLPPDNEGIIEEEGKVDLQEEGPCYREDLGTLLHAPIHQLREFACLNLDIGGNVPNDHGDDVVQIRIRDLYLPVAAGGHAVPSRQPLDVVREMQGTGPDG